MALTGGSCPPRAAPPRPARSGHQHGNGERRTNSTIAPTTRPRLQQRPGEFVDPASRHRAAEQPMASAPASSAPITAAGAARRRPQAQRSHAATMAPAMAGPGERAHQVQPEARNTPATMPMTMASAPPASRAHPPGAPASHQKPGANIRADDFGKAEVRSAGPTSTGPGWSRRRPRAGGAARRTGGDRRVDEEGAEQPGRELRFAQAALAADRKDDGQRAVPRTASR